MRRSTLSTVLSVFFATLLFGQSTTDLAIGQWKQHLPFRGGLYVTQSSDQVFYSTAQALLVIDKIDRSRRQVTKVEGLSRVGVNLVKYNKGSEVLVVVFNDGAIDLISDEGNRTLLGVPISSVTIGEKRINDVFMANDSIAYLAGNFGVVTLNVRQGLFPRTVKMPIEVNSVAVFNGNVYAATMDGVYTIAEDTPLNFDDFNNWEWINGTDGFPIDFTAGATAVFNNQLYVDVSDSLYVYDGTSASLLTHEEGFSLTYLSAEGAHLIAGFNCDTNCKGKVFIYNEDHTHREPAGDCLIFPTYAVEDEKGDIWFADRASNFRVESGGGGNCAQLMENSYATELVYDIAVGNGQVWVAAGGLDIAGSARLRPEGFSSLIGGEWVQHGIFTEPALAGIFDFLDIKIHPDNGKIYAGAFLDALVEYDPETDSYKIFNETNSSLQLSEGDIDRSRVAGLAFDRDNNLWVCNSNAPEPLSVMRAEGGWESFDICSADNSLLEVVIDDFGNKWLITNESSTGVIVFDSGDLNVAGDDRCRVINTSNSELPTNDISSIQVDLDGAVWVGTNQGAVVFQCDPFNPDCRGSRPFVEVDGFGANLLEDQDVTAIGIDGANRKWFGTQTGIFVMSPEGNEQIANFTEENSPLFSNRISDIAFDYETGEAWIGTSQGLISYRSDATLGGNFHQRSGVLVFPNPVRPDYEGPIAIKGLAQDATVKITDITGQLVFETEANGGQAIWNARDYNGRKVNTGVYLVFATSRNINDPDVAVAKVLVVN